MRLALIRHGETTWNFESRLQGRSDAPLSELGRDQVRALAPLFAGYERVVRSPLERAAETAVLLGHGQAEVDERWVELDLGEWTSRWVSDLPEDDIEAWRSGAHVPPGAEPFDDAVRRVGGAIDELNAGETAAALVITHGGAIRAAVTYVTGCGRHALAPVAPASVTVVDLDTSQLVAYGAPASLDALLAVKTADVM